MRLQLATWPEVERYLEKCDAIVIPLGSTEQHGPNGLIGTDAVCAENVAWRGAQESAPILIGPTQALTPAQFNLGFPGTVSLRASTFLQVLEDMVSSLARSGFRRFYFLNGHGANISVARAAIHDLHQARSLQSEGKGDALRFRFRSWWDFEQTNALRKELYGDREGLHATPSEVAISQAVVNRETPEFKSMEFTKLAPEFFVDHAGDNHDDSRSHRAAFADGRVGSDPQLATPQAGKQLLELAAAEFAADFRDFASAAHDATTTGCAT